MAEQPVQLMIIGAQKAGTTTLFHYLQRHPGIITHRQREMTFFFNDHELREGYKQAFRRYFGDQTRTSGVILAKHALAMYSADALRQLYLHNPNTQLVILLRNPIERAYSAYWYARRRGWETLTTFEAALKAEPRRLATGGWRQWRNCAYQYNGLYAEHVERVYDVFDKKQVHIYLSEELRSNAEAVCQEIFHALEIDPALAGQTHLFLNRAAIARSEAFAQIFARFLSSKHPLKMAVRSLIPDSVSCKLRYLVLRVNEKGFTPPGMLPETRKQLRTFFYKDNEKLEALLGRNLVQWLQ
ncbi:MAG: sulfotransferase domain-containing protein [Deltaproteobacteria bacterium]|nr:sulfotransferase domain-containing protein [Deltaproteobacteria bacterium]